MTNYINKKLRLPLLSLLTLATLFGCSKMVDVDLPHNQVTAGGAFISNDQATSVVAGIYSQLMTNTGSKVFSNGGVTLYAGLSADELESYTGVAALDYPFLANKLLADNTFTPSIIWQPAYKVIFSCNTAIEGINQSASASLDAATRTQLIGEAKFIRAFTYFYLVNLFGDIPMPLVGDFNETSKLPRTPVAGVYAQIINDLKDAQANLQANYAVSPKVSNVDDRIRANKFAATALLARVYLYNKEWANAEAAATEVINSSLYGLGTIDNLFLKNTSETILALKQNVTKIPYNGTHDANAFVTVNLLTPSSGLYTTAMSSASTYATISSLFFSNYNMTARLASAFETGDLRKTKWTVSWPSPAGAPYNSRTFYTPNKYKVRVDGAPPATTIQTEYYIALRISEQYLIRAEARANLNNLSGAALDLRPIRTRAGLADIPTTSQAQVLDAIARERQVELFAEWGHRWLDLKRTGKAEAALSTIADKQPWNNNQLLYPIPLSDLANNPMLKQNPGYE